MNRKNGQYLIAGRSHILHGIRWTLMTSVLRRLVSILLLYFIANWLSKEDFGLFRTYSLILAVLAFLSGLGLDYHYLTEKRRPLLNLFATLQIGLFGALILLLLLPLLAGFLGGLYHSPELAKVLRWSSVFVLLEMLRRSLRVIAQKALLFKDLAIAETVNVFVYSLLAIVLLWFHRSVVLYILVFYLGNACEAVWLLCRIPDLPRGLIPRVFSGKWLLRSLQMMRVNALFLVNVVSVYVINVFSGNAPILFLGTLVSPVYMGLYFFATQLIGIPISMFTTSLNQVFFPVFARTENSSSLSGIAQYSRLIIRIALPLLLLYGFALQYLIPLFLGDKWNAALPLVYYLIIFYGSSMLHLPISGVPYICRKPHWELIWNVITLALRLLLLLVGLRYGFNFAVLLFCIGSGIMNFAFYGMSIHLLKGNAASFIRKAGIDLVPIAVLVSAVLLLSGWDVMPDIFSVATVSAIYLSFLVIFERPLFKSFLALLKLRG